MGLYKFRKYWYLDYCYGDMRIRRSCKTTNKRIAEIELGRIKREIEEGEHDIKRESKIPFETMAKEYLDRYAKVNKRSFFEDERICRKHLGPFFKNKYLHQITPLLLEDYKAIKTTAGKSPATVNRHLACLKTIFSKAVEWGRAKENPVKRIKLFKENNQRTRFLEKGEIKILLDCCEKLLQPVVMTALNTGMRFSEILGLTWNDMDFERGIISVRNTKNGEPRFIPMNSDLINTLEELKLRANLDSPYVFCNNRGRRRTRFGAIRNSWARAIKQAGIKDFHFHDLRHTFASHLAMKGVDIMTIMKLLGHKTLAMTLRYSHLSPNHMRSAVELISTKKCHNFVIIPQPARQGRVQE